MAHFYVILALYVVGLVFSSIGKIIRKRTFVGWWSLAVMYSQSILMAIPVVIYVTWHKDFVIGLYTGGLFICVGLADWIYSYWFRKKYSHQPFTHPLTKYLKLK